MQGLLFNGTHIRKDVYQYEINSGGDCDVNEQGFITIRFRDGEFDGCDFPFSGEYSRNAWRILKDVAEKITELEEDLENE